MRTDGRADRRTDIRKLIAAFRSFAIAHKNIHWRLERPDGGYKYLMESDLDENDRYSFGTTFGISPTCVWSLSFLRIRIINLFGTKVKFLRKLAKIS
jgi:hypothetical protein